MNGSSTSMRCARRRRILRLQISGTTGSIRSSLAFDLVEDFPVVEQGIHQKASIAKSTVEFGGFADQGPCGSASAPIRARPPSPHGWLDFIEHLTDHGSMTMRP